MRVMSASRDGCATAAAYTALMLSVSRTKEEAGKGQMRCSDVDVASLTRDHRMGVEAYTRRAKACPLLAGDADDNIKCI